MGEFFELLLGNMYCWFKSFYPENLSLYLWGYNPASGVYDLELRYNSIGLYTLVISFAIMFVYYYVIAHPRFCKWWSWLIMALLNSVIALFVGYYCVLSDYNAGKIPDELMYVRNENGEVVQTLISIPSDCWSFGISNMIIAFIFFLVFSFLFHWWSRVAKYSPFIKF
jgi:hypothetical protein